jgi:microsomal dipeptidase-like Zn-dependent dipeptidase
VIADLHAHYPMHVIVDVTPRTTVDLMRTMRGAPGIPAKIQQLILAAATRLLSDESLWSGHRITVPYMRQGGVGVVLSVLYRPFEEMDLSKPYKAPPSAEYFDKLLDDLQAVEDEVGVHDRGVIRAVHDSAELDRCIADQATALVHCVEGGFHLGGTSDDVRNNVATLAGKGVAYITIAHLFFRQVATNANAVPFIPDPIYDLVFPQRTATPLTARGRGLIAAMVDHRIIVDVSHMRPDAVTATFDLLDELDPERRLPVISSHAGYRFGGQAYMHDEEIIRRIQRRDGVIGLIMAQHQLNDGIRKKTETLADSLEVIRCHIDKIKDITGSHRHVAIGTDFDGFVKPTLSGLEDMRSVKRLEDELRTAYGADADLILSENVLRVLRTTWS